MHYIVVCREDQKEDGSPGDYTLATRTLFPTPEAAETYASTCAPERQAIVVEGRFTELRQDFDERFGQNPQLAMTECEKHGHAIAIRHEAGLVCRACFIGASAVRPLTSSRDA